MSLRQLLQEDVDRLRQQLEDVLDAEDGFVVLVDRERAISYAAGFALSGSQLEQVAAEVERVIRIVVGPVRRVNGRKEHDSLLMVLASVLFAGIVGSAIVLQFNWRRSLRPQILGPHESFEFSARGIDAAFSASFPRAVLPHGLWAPHVRTGYGSERHDRVYGHQA